MCGVIFKGIMQVRARRLLFQHEKSIFSNVEIGCGDTDRGGVDNYRKLVVAFFVKWADA